MKNPYTITIFGQSYDGSNQVTVEVPIASSSTLGCVKPIAKTSTMTREVGVDSSGRLWTTILTIDSVVTSGSDHAVSSNAVWNYGNDLADSARKYVDEQLSAHETDYTQRIQEVQNNLDQTNTNVTNLTQRVSTAESDITAIKSKNTEQDNSISQINTNITALQEKNTSQDTAIQQVQTNLDNKATQIESEIQSVKTQIEEDYDEQISGLQQQINSNDTDITQLQSGLSTANQNISQNTQKISQNASNITALQERCTTIEGKVSTNTTSITTLTQRVGTAESNIQTQTSRVNTLSATVSGHTTQIASLQSEENGRFFTSESELLQWVENSENTKNLQVGAGLYVNNDDSMYYIWDGTKTLRFQYIEVPDGGYMVRNNPVGVGSMTMNDCQAGTGSAAFGEGNRVNVSNGFASGEGIIVSEDNAFGVGSYNQTPVDNEIFSVGVGTSGTDRKSAMRLLSDGFMDLSGDLTIFSSELSPAKYPFTAKCHSSITARNMPDNVVMNVNYDMFYSAMGISEDDTYALTYSNAGWLTGQARTYITDLSTIGITFAYTDGTAGTPSIEFSLGDTITIYAPQQPEVSLRNFYSAFASMGLYVDADGDVCQEDS